MFENREQALARLDELREQLEDPAADLEAIQGEIEQIEPFLGPLAEVVEEVAAEATETQGDDAKPF